MAKQKKKKKYRAFWLFAKLQLVLLLLVLGACPLLYIWRLRKGGAGT